MFQIEIKVERKDNQNATRWN